jgi:hypothetical protein
MDLINAYQGDTKSEIISYRFFMMQRIAFRLDFYVRQQGNRETEVFLISAAYGAQIYFIERPSFSIASIHKLFLTSSGSYNINSPWS